MQNHGFEQTKWVLDDLLAPDQAQELSARFDELESRVCQIEEQRRTLAPDMDEQIFLDLLRQIKDIQAMATRLDSYGGLWFASDTQSSEALTFQNQVDEQLAQIRNRLLFFELWWKDLEDTAARRLLETSGDDAYYLKNLRRFKPHTLSESEEKVINIKDVNGSNALNTVYSMITNGFTYKLDVEGETKELTRGELSVYIQGPSADLRAAAYRELYRVFEGQSKVLAQIYNHLVRDWFSENIGLRQFASPISVRNLYNDIPDPVVDTLLDVCQQNVSVFQRYFRWKAKQLGMETLKRYDIYAPVSESDKIYPFDQAADLVLDTFERFSPEIAHLAQRVFAEGHLDAEVRIGKDSGAFCASTLPELTPWVLLNYNDRASDVATMAHELGHAIHAQLAGEHSILTFHSALPMAETASVFAERLLVDRLLSEEPDVSVRRDLLVDALDDAYATVMRQAYFVLFERQAHEMIAQGASVSELGVAYMDNLQEQFGDAVALSDEFRWEWISIPHIYAVPFYCYAYSFGQLLVLSLYQQYKEQGTSFIPKYLRILSHGGSRSPEYILTEAGIDMASASFWQGGFDVVRGMIDELEELV